ncbi:MAG TPA: hypothetical protein VFD58_18355 [Blastocatellia bacterium]|nr:hypothetical protein [Blastocatellia bacterium]
MATPKLSPQTSPPFPGFELTVSWQARLTDGSLIRCAIGFCSEEIARKFYQRINAATDDVPEKVLLRGDYTKVKQWAPDAVIESVG